MGTAEGSSSTDKSRKGFLLFGTLDAEADVGALFGLREGKEAAMGAEGVPLLDVFLARNGLVSEFVDSVLGRVGVGTGSSKGEIRAAARQAVLAIVGLSAWNVEKEKRRGWHKRKLTCIRCERL